MPVFLYDLLLKRCTSVHFWGQIWTKPFLMKACAIPPWRSMNNKSPSSLLKSIQMNHIPALCWAKIGWIEATTTHPQPKNDQTSQVEIWIHPLDYKMFHLALNLVGYKMKHIFFSSKPHWGVASAPHLQVHHVLHHQQALPQRESEIVRNWRHYKVRWLIQNHYKLL